MTTKERIEHQWEIMVEQKEYLTITEFCKRAMISNSTLYHCYPEWAKKIRKRRDSVNKIKKRKVPSELNNNQDESIQTISKLREEVKKLNEELKETKKENEKLKKNEYNYKNTKEVNERLRGVLAKSYDIIKKHVDGKKAEKIIDEITKYHSSHLKGLD